MAAGLGFKDFTTGEVLTAADVDGYLMQGIWVFASAAARDAAVTSPQEGNFAFLKDTNTTTYYTGSAWTNLDTTGMVNPMTTTGDTIYSSSGSTPARLGIGTTGQVLTVAGGVPTWATPGGGSSFTKVAGASFTGQSSVAVDGCFTTTYKRYFAIWQMITNSNAADLYLQFRYGSTTSTSGYYGAGFGYLRDNTLRTWGFNNTNQATIIPDLNNTYTSSGVMYFCNLNDNTLAPQYHGTGLMLDNQTASNYTCSATSGQTYDGFILSPSTGTITGSYAVYGLEN